MVLMRPADVGDVGVCSRLTQAHRHELGFTTRSMLLSSIAHRSLAVAVLDGEVVGLVRFNVRKRDSVTVIYELVVGVKRRGVGSALVAWLAEYGRGLGSPRITLRCPEGLAANDFYAAVGFQHDAIEEGRKRRLWVWSLTL